MVGTWNGGEFNMAKAQQLNGATHFWCVPSLFKDLVSVSDLCSSKAFK